MILSEEFAAELSAIAQLAGKKILEVRAGRDLDLQSKADGSPVTRADHASQAAILEGLARLTPDIPVIAEEQHGSHLAHAHDTYWLVDPLDGTRDFITGHNDFSVNICLVVNNAPAVGVIYAPARDDLMFGTSGNIYRIVQGNKKTITSASVASHAIQPPRLVISIRDAKKNPTEQWLAAGHISSCSIRASAYKILLVAAGEADLFIRTGITSEWDTAAGDAILRALGGQILMPDGTPLTYNKPNLANGALLAFRQDFDRVQLPHFLNLINPIRA